jgi:hypothetical protein
MKATALVFKCCRTRSCHVKIVSVCHHTHTKFRLHLALADGGLVKIAGKLQGLKLRTLVNAVKCVIAVPTIRRDLLWGRGRQSLKNTLTQWFPNCAPRRSRAPRNIQIFSLKWHLAQVVLESDHKICFWRAPITAYQLVWKILSRR